MSRNLNYIPASYLSRLPIRDTTTINYLGAQFQDGKAVTADRHHRGRLATEEEPVAADLRLLRRHLGQPDLPPQPPAHRRAVELVPIPIREQFPQPRSGRFVVLHDLPPCPAPETVFAPDFHGVDRLRADVEADEAPAVRVVRSLHGGGK